LEAIQTGIILVYFVVEYSTPEKYNGCCSIQIMSQRLKEFENIEVKDKAYQFLY